MIYTVFRIFAIRNNRCYGFSESERGRSHRFSLLLDAHMQVTEDAKLWIAQELEKIKTEHDHHQILQIPERSPAACPRRFEELGSGSETVGDPLYIPDLCLASFATPWV